jgi:hypothetical protein
MKNKTAVEIRELIDNMSLNEYHPKIENIGVLKKQRVLRLEIHDALLERNKLLSDKIDALAKRLEAQEVAKLSINGVSCDFCEQAHESGVCLPDSLGLSEEKVKYMGAHTRQQRGPYSNKFNFGWPNRQKNSSEGNNNIQQIQVIKQEPHQDKLKV